MIISLQAARESIGLIGPTKLKTSKSEDKNPSLKSGDIGKILNEIDSRFEAPLNSIKAILFRSLLNLKQDEVLTYTQQYKLAVLLYDDKGQWLQKNFTELPPESISMIVSACKFSKVGESMIAVCKYSDIGKKLWTVLVSFLAKEANASQLQAFVLTYPPYGGENKLSWQERQRGEAFANHAVWIIKNWHPEHQEIINKLPLEKQKGWIKSLVGFAAAYEKSIDSLFSFIESLPTDLRATAIEELNQTTSPKMLFELLARDWGNEQILDTLWPVNQMKSNWSAVIYEENATGKSLTSCVRSVYNLLMQSPADRRQEIENFFSSLDIINENNREEIWQVLGREIKPQHLVKLSKNGESNPISEIAPIVNMVKGAMDLPSVDERDEVLRTIAKLVTPLILRSPFEREFEKSPVEFMKLYDTDELELQAAMLKKLPDEHALPLFQKLSPERLELIGNSYGDLIHLSQGPSSKLVLELSIAQTQGLLKGLSKGKGKALKLIVTTFIQKLYTSPQQAQVIDLIDQMETTTLIHIHLFHGLILLLTDMTKPNQRELIRRGVVDRLENYASNSSLHSILKVFSQDQLLSLPLETLPPALGLIILSLSKAPAEKWKKTLAYIEDLQMGEEDLKSFGMLLENFDFDARPLFKALTVPLKHTGRCLLKIFVKNWENKLKQVSTIPKEIIDQITGLSEEQFTVSMADFCKGNDGIRHYFLENSKVHHKIASKLWG